MHKVQESNKIGVLLTEQYGGLSSKEFETFLKEENIIHIFTAIDSPASNGLNERLNQTLVNRIRCRFNENKTKFSWTTIAQRCVQEYNNPIHNVTGFSPNYLMNGIKPYIVPLEVDVIRNFETDGKTALQNSIKNHERNKRRYDNNRIDLELDVNDMIYVENGNKLNRGKLDEICIGPFPITEKV